MSLLKILEFPDPRLRTIAKPVTEFDERLETLVNDMFETMEHADGIGLAATQVNVHKRVVVMNITEERDDPTILINPSFEELTEELQDYSEGCLSVPGFVESVTRCARIRVNAQDLKGNAISFECDGLKAICIQHELDHLDGKLFVDHISSLKRQRIRKKLEKIHRNSKES